MKNIGLKFQTKGVYLYLYLMILIVSEVAISLIESAVTKDYNYLIFGVGACIFEVILFVIIIIYIKIRKRLVIH